MKRELDEIELELKGVESMEYKCGFWPSTFGAGVLCGRVILCPMIPRSTCPHRGPIPSVERGPHVPLEPGGPGMSEITFNVNHKVKAKLNDRGRKIQAEYYAPFGDGPKPDSDGWTEYQMWCLMHVFGEHCYMGPEPPFETNIRIIVDESERDALRKEVERYKRALEWVLRKTVDSMDCPPELHGKECDGPSNRECVKCVSKWALSEAGK